MIRNKLQYKVIVYLNKINYNTNFKSIIYIRFTNIYKRFQKLTYGYIQIIQFKFRMIIDGSNPNSFENKNGISI